jgi:hypothetical protein
MTTKINYSNLESAAWDNIYAILNNRTYIADPRNRPSGAFIYDADPILTKSFGFNGYPYIVEELPTIEFSHNSEDGRYKQVVWKQKLLVRTARDGSANTRTDVGRSDIFAINDDLFQTFNSLAVRDVLARNEVSNVTLNKTGASNPIIDQKYTYEATYELTYNQRFLLSP